MVDYPTSINRQYGRKDLNAQILTAFEEAGISIDALTLDDLAWFDQLHTSGIYATRLLADMAGLKPGMEVLDIGSGIGGPARTLSVEFGCQVIGLEITKEYIKAAQMLTDMVGQSENVTFQEGDGLDLKFGDGSFDAVWTQSAIMNIENKYQVFQEVHRVLRCNGIFAIEAFMEGSKEETQFPVFWADSPTVSFLTTSEHFRKMMDQIGFNELVWKDVTQQAIQGFRRAKTAPEDGTNPLGGIFNIIQSDLPHKRKNVLFGLENGTYEDIYAVYRRAT